MESDGQLDSPALTTVLMQTLFGHRDFHGFFHMVSFLPAPPNEEFLDRSAAAGVRAISDRTALGDRLTDVNPWLTVEAAAKEQDTWPNKEEFEQLIRQTNDRLRLRGIIASAIGALEYYDRERARGRMLKTHRARHTIEALLGLLDTLQPLAESETL